MVRKTTTYDYIRVDVCKETLHETHNTRKIRVFWKWPKMAATQRL